MNRLELFPVGSKRDRGSIRAEMSPIGNKGVENGAELMAGEDGIRLSLAGAQGKLP